MAQDLLLGVDLGGTKILVGLAEHRRGAGVTGSDVRLLGTVQRSTEVRRGFHHVVAEIESACRRILANHQRSLSEVRCMGVAAPGPLDPKDGVVLAAPNLPGWHHRPLGAELRRALGRPVRLANDANLAAVGEHSRGAGRGVDDMVYLTVSTGIGGGIIIGGRLYEGFSYQAGELGHMIVDVGGPLCAAGHPGCLEAMASGTAIAREGRAAALAARSGGPATALTRLARGGDIAISGADVVAAAQGGDEVAAAIVHQAATYLGWGLVNVIHALNPSRIVVGGGVIHAGPLLFRPARAVVRQYVFADARRHLRIVRAGLGQRSVLWGALILAAQAED